MAAVLPWGDGPSLTIADGGVLSDDTGIMNGSLVNMALITGPGSVWSNSNDLSLDGEGGNSLVISNGGAVYDVNGSIGQYNTALVTGPSSVWSNSRSLIVAGQEISVIISNGGAVYSASGNLNSSPGSKMVNNRWLGLAHRC